MDVWPWFSCYKFSSQPELKVNASVQSTDSLLIKAISIHFHCKEIRKSIARPTDHVWVFCGRACSVICKTIHFLHSHSIETVLKIDVFTSSSYTCSHSRSVLVIIGIHGVARITEGLRAFFGPDEGVQHYSKLLYISPVLTFKVTDASRAWCWDMSKTTWRKIWCRQNPPEATDMHINTSMII